jgi:hypothetical protein
MVQRFPTEPVPEVSSLCAICGRVLSWRKNHTIAKTSGTFSRDTAPRIFQKVTSSTREESQKPLASILPADGVAVNFFLHEPVCFHSVVDCLLVVVK